MALEFDTSFVGFSFDNALFLAKACQMAYEKKDEKLNKEAENLGLGETVKTFELIDEEDLADYRGFVGATEEVAILVFRGVQNLDPWLSDATIVQKPGFGGLIHKGFAEALDSLWADLEPLVNEVREGKQLWIAGHDLGGALAVLAAARLQKDGADVTGVYTFGCPRVGNVDFFNNYKVLTYRLVNNNDVIPHIPGEIISVKGYNFYQYKHVGSLKYFDRHKQYEEGTTDWGVKKRLIYEHLLRVSQPPTEWLWDHHLDAYISAIEANL
jgi:triacylglycerol lipase